MDSPALNTNTNKIHAVYFSPIYEVVYVCFIEIVSLFTSVTVIKMHSSEKCSSNIDLFYARNPSSDSDQLQQETQNEEPDFEAIVAALDENVEKLKQSISMVIEKKASHGIWEPTLKRVKVVENKGLKQYLPHSMNGQFYLHPFEALFALECRVLAIRYHDVPLSIEDGYSILLSDKNEAKLYQVFSTLSKSGYFVKKQDKTEKEKNNSTAFSEPMNFNKHLMDDDSHNTAKKLKADEESNQSGQRKDNVNYKAVTSVRPLAVYHLRNFSKIDQKMQTCFQLDGEAPKSVLYCIRNSAVPVEMNRRLKHLHDDDHLRPLVELSAVHTSEHLFAQLQQAGPKSSSSSSTVPDEHLVSHDKELSVDFEVFPPKTSLKSSRRDLPLFRVVTIVNENDPLPPVSVMRRLQRHHHHQSAATIKSSPLLFALITDSLEFNFYALESLPIHNEYPTLWEKYYADQ